MKVSLKLDRRTAKKDGTHPVVVNVWNRDKIRISTGYSSSESNWDAAAGLYNKKERNYSLKNARLKDILNQVERLAVSLDSEHRSVPDRELRNMITGILFPERHREKPGCFIGYLDEFIAGKKNASTKTIYTTTRNKLLQYDPRCTFETMDAKWLRRFEEWMARTMKVNAYAIHLRNVRAVFNYCIDEEYTTLYPFRKFSIKKEETRKRCLTVEQLRTLRDYPCEPYQEKYRDMFLLMFYLIGINAADLFLARKTDVVNGRLEYKRHKTGKLYSVKIEPEAQEIIARYAGKGDYLLGIMDVYGNYKDFLHRMGTALKQIGETERHGLGGRKERKPLFPGLSSYWSRHTWATVAAELDVPVETISRALGHSIGSSVTSIYIRFDERKIDEANRRVIDHVNESPLTLT